MHGVQFDAYEYLAFIIPGAILLIGLIILFPWLREHIGPKEHPIVDLGGLGVFLIVSFVAGHLLQGLGHYIVLGESYWGSEASYATNSVLNDDQDILAKSDKVALTACITSHLAHKTIPKSTLAQDDLVLWRSTVREILEKVSEGGRSDIGKSVVAKPDVSKEVKKDQENDQERVNSKMALLLKLQRNFALNLDLATACIVLMLCVTFVALAPSGLLKELGVAKASATIRWIQFGVLAAALFIAVDRLHNYNVTFARDLYLAFLLSPTCTGT